MPSAPVSARYRLFVMGMLVLVYTFNFIDRQIIGILAVPIKADLGLNDTQLGLMGGLAFALFYTTLGIPIALLADRMNRTWILSVSLALWSLMTALCGTVTNFWQLFLARLGVGVGEAGGVAPAYSMICDYYPAPQRARALSAYSFGVPIGSALGIIFGGLIASKVDWRYAFFAVGIAGVVLAPIFKLTVREPLRGQFDEGMRSEPVAFAESFSVLLGKPSFWLMAVGASFSSMMGYGLFFWLPSFFVRSFDMTLLNASLFYGTILLFGGLVGIWLGGMLADRLGASRKTAYVLVPAGAFLATAPFYLAAVLSNQLWLTFFLMLVPTALGLAWLGPVLSAIQHVVVPSMRATASAVFLLVINLIGLGVGTAALGWLSDLLEARYAEDSLRYAIVAGTVFYLIAALLLYLASKYLERDWEQVATPQNSSPAR
ncbi:MAG: spinster family MFS transporter [Gammaproteobacteria bacterium]